MASSQSLQQIFRQHFSKVVKHWADLRQSRAVSGLAAFSEELADWQVWSQEQRLHALDHLLDELIKICNEQTQIDDGLVGKIDVLLNRLITSAKNADNPYLVQAELRRSAPVVTHQVTIAIIDDSEIARISTKAMLDRFNFDVLVFESIFDFEADKEAQAITDVVLLDVIMPDVDEETLFTFARQVRDQGTHIILVSAVDEFDIRLKAVRADIGGYVTKPFDINLLVSNIRWMCDLDVERPFQVLLLDDQPLVGSYLKTYAKKNAVDLRYYETSHALFYDLDMGVPDLFLLDVNMPDVSGIEVCKILRQQQRFEYVPIVFLSADDSLDTKLEALTAGGDDVIIKNNPPDVIFKQIERRIIRGQQIRTMAVKDSLTGLLNHGQMMDAAASAYRLAQRNQSQIAVAMIDIDNFKQVNDCRGHMVGDNVILGLAQLLKTSVRESDVVGRYGGEEFLVVFHSDDINAIEAKLNGMCHTFSKLQFKDGNESFHCTFSCGVSTSLHADSLKDMINLADKMMYDVKKSGKNGIKIAPHSS